MWSNITVHTDHVTGGTCDSNAEGIVVISFSITECMCIDDPIVPDMAHHAPVRGVSRMIHDIIQSCNLQHGTADGGEYCQLLLDYHRCDILLNGASEPSADVFVEKIRKSVGIAMACHVTALCTQGVLADFLVMATESLRSENAAAILIDRSSSESHTLSFHVRVRTANHVSVSVRKQLSIPDHS